MACTGRAENLEKHRRDTDESLPPTCSFLITDLATVSEEHSIKP